MTAQRSAGGRVWALTDQAVQSATNFITMVLAARYLDVQEFAHFSLAYLAVLFALSFHRTWVTQPMNVLGTQEPRELGARVRALWRAHGVLIPAGAAVCAVVAIFAFRDTGLLLATVAYLALYFLQEMQRRYAYTVFRIRPAAMMSLGMGGAQLCGIATLAVTDLHWNVSWMTVLALSQAVGLFVGFTLVRLPERSMEQRRMGVMSVLVEQYQHSRWIVASQVVYWASSQIFPFLIAGVDTEQAATFNAGMSILNAVNVMRMTLANYLPGYAGRLRAQEGTAALCAFTRRALSAIALAGIVIWPLLFLVSTPLVRLLYADKFEGAEQVLSWVALGMWASMFSVVLNTSALAFGSTRNIFFSNAAGAIFSCTAGVYLTVRFGLQGAILSNVVGYVLPALLQILNMWPRVRPVH